MRDQHDDFPLNVLGKPLEPCCFEPRTGYLRDGFCRTSEQDRGSHLICAQVTEAFLRFSHARGNDLITPHPEFDFPGLKPGDRWCLCALRWKEAWEAGTAPPVILESCHQQALHYIPLEVLQSHAIASRH